MSWQFCSALEAFDRHHSLWDAINGDCGNHILLDSEFWHCLIKYFGSANTVLAFTEKKNGRAAALIERGAYGFWQTFQPCQAPIGPILFDKSASLHWHEHICDLMADLPGYALGFAATQQDPDFTCFGSINGAAAIEAINYIQTPRLSVRGKYEDYWNQRSKNLTHNLSRQRRRLKEQGRVLDLVIERNPETVVDAVREYGLLESTGWKGDEGSAVAADNVQGRFYRDVLETFSRRGEAVIYRLHLNGKTVASDLCLKRDGTLFILKTAYDESVQGLSLGLLLHHEIFQSVFKEGKIRVIEFYGRVRDWHTKWTNETRNMYHLNFYRYGWIAAGRRILKSSSAILNR